MRCFLPARLKVVTDNNNITGSNAHHIITPFASFYEAAVHCDHVQQYTHIITTHLVFFKFHGMKGVVRFQGSYLIKGSFINDSTSTQIGANILGLLIQDNTIDSK